MSEILNQQIIVEISYDQKEGNSLGKKIILSGLTTSEYIHPMERDSILKLDQIICVSEILDQLSDLGLAVSRQIILGKYVEVLPEMLSELHNALREVCQILNFCGDIHPLITREYQPSCIQLGRDQMYILIPDWMIQKASPDMLYFLLGNAIGMFKGGHIRLATATSVLQYVPEALPVRLVLQARQRAADLSSDRAGLLACQNFPDAVRCILWDMGMPADELLSFQDEEILDLVQDYIQDMSALYQGELAEAATTWMKWNGTVSPGYFRLKELYQWYNNGYQQLIKRYGF